jgi:hypothetical protein
MIDEDLQYDRKHMCFSFNVDEPVEVIYEELVNKAYIMDYDLEHYGKTPTFKNWTMDDFKRFYEETDNDRDKLVQKLNDTFCIEWFNEPTVRPKITLKRDEFPLMMFDHIYKLHSFKDRRYVKRKIKYAMSQHPNDNKAWLQGIIDVIEKYYDVNWND